MKQFDDCHAHVYFDDASMETARQVCTEVAEKFALAMGHMHEGPVGPHPVGSCQLTVPAAVLGEVLAWLAINRQDLTVFAHLSTGDHLKDHRDHAIWLGRQIDLDLTMFQPDE